MHGLQYAIGQAIQAEKEDIQRCTASRVCRSLPGLRFSSSCLHKDFSAFFRNVDVEEPELLDKARPFLQSFVQMFSKIVTGTHTHRKHALLDVGAVLCQWH